VTILGYSPPDFELPSNFGFQSLGRPEQFGNEITEWSEGRRGHSLGEPFPTPRWSDSLKGWLDRLLDPHFILLQIDYFIHRPVNILQIQALEKYLDVEGVVKIDLSCDRTYFAHSFYAYDDGMGIIVSDQADGYRSSLQAAIWKREYFGAMLQSGRSPWDFEIKGMEEHMNDGKLILGLKLADDPPVPYLNIYSKGKVNWRKLDRLVPGSAEPADRAGGTECLPGPLFDHVLRSTRYRLQDD
jgi:hypothetical protein